MVWIFYCFNWLIVSMFVGPWKAEERTSLVPENGKGNEFKGQII